MGRNAKAKRKNRVEQQIKQGRKMIRALKKQGLIPPRPGATRRKEVK